MPTKLISVDANWLGVDTLSSWMSRCQPKWLLLSAYSQLLIRTLMLRAALSSCLLWAVPEWWQLKRAEIVKMSAQQALLNLSDKKIREHSLKLNKKQNKNKPTKIFFFFMVIWFFFASFFFLKISSVLHKISVRQHTMLLAHLERLILEENLGSWTMAISKCELPCPHHKMAKPNCRWQTP